MIIKNFSFDDITEIRLRVNSNIVIAVKNKKYYLKDNDGNYLKTSRLMLDNFIKKISENSIYAFNENIINGYITLTKGVRVGICGTVVRDGDKVITIKDFVSVNIRIPHIVNNCSLPAYEFIVQDEVKNTLIISSPGCGKTTFLRDFIHQLNRQNVHQNILVADERNEIFSISNGEPAHNVAGFCDIYTNCSKEFALKNGIRSMSPDVIITDEIDLDLDLKNILEAVNCGVKVVATIHAKDIKQLQLKKGFDEIINKKLFERYVILTNDEGPGTLTHIYDEKLNCIYCKS